jgi:hypothetical protein
MKKLFFGRHSPATTKSALRRSYSNFELLLPSLGVVTDKFSGKSRGIAFSTIGGEQTSDAAIKELVAGIHDGCSIMLCEARPHISSV